MEFHKVVAGATAAGSFILLGNAITQSFMGVPALLVDFPPPSSPEHASRARLLGRQWPVFWRVGNSFFRPLSTAGILGYGVAAWSLASAPITSPSAVFRDGWKLYALAAACHVVTVVHSAINMQPINAQLDGLREVRPGVGGVEVKRAEEYARRWIRLNMVRLVMPLVAGSLALWTVVRSR